MKYTVHAPTRGVPYLGSVLTPTLTRTYGGWSSRGRVYGQPGTQMVPVQHESLHFSVNDLANVGTSHSSCSPDVILPPIYFENDPPALKEHAPVSRISDNQMPVPSMRAANVLKSSPYRARLGGQGQVVQPQVIPTWRPWRGMNG